MLDFAAYAIVVWLKILKKIKIVIGGAIGAGEAVTFTVRAR